MKKKKNHEKSQRLSFLVITSSYYQKLKSNHPFEKENKRNIFYEKETKLQNIYKKAKN